MCEGNMRSVNSQNISDTAAKRSGEQGSAIVIALFVLALISVFVAIALRRTSAEAAAVGNEAAESRTFYAAQGSLEMMTRNFDKLFDRGKTKITTLDLDRVRNGEVPGLGTTSTPAGQYTFGQEVTLAEDKGQVVLTDKAFAGLYAKRDSWQLRTTATDPNGVEVQLTRNILNNRIPIFQFGIFYDDDLELFRPPLFSFGGRVHSNRHFFLSPGADGVYFDSRVTAVGHIVTESWRNGYSDDHYNTARIKDASGVFQVLNNTEGSVKNGTGNILRDDPKAKCTEFDDYPGSTLNGSWTAIQSRFDGNLQNRAPELNLPLKKIRGDDCSSNADLIEIIKRPKNVGTDLAVTNASKNASNPVLAAVPASGAPEDAADSEVMRESRYANKPGIRISFADTKRRLPGCAAAINTDVCGKNLRLNMPSGGTDVNAVVRRMRKSLSDSTNYEVTPLNYSRFDQPVLPSGETGSGLWVKVEAVALDDVTGNIITSDITEEFLSLGVTDLPENLRNTCTSLSGGATCFVNRSGSLADNGTATNPSTTLKNTTTPALGASTYQDSRSVIKLQRFSILGREDNNYKLTGSSNLSGFRQTLNGETKWFYYYKPASGGEQIRVHGNPNDSGNFSVQSTMTVEPIPIKMFDGREGLYYDQRSTTYYPNSYYSSYTNLPIDGVMSMVDIDVANLRRFFRGDFDGLFPSGTSFAQSTGTTLKSTDFRNTTGTSIVREDGGWVLYISDRRGDYDFDGEFDMEDVYGRAASVGNDEIKQSGEDVNADGELNRRFGTEAARYRDTVTPLTAAIQDQRYYRRGVRLINGTVLPGEYNSANPTQTRGFTVASENGLYIKGNYNAEGLYNTPPSTANSPFDDYKPYNTATHIPASIVADGVTILSNNWNDAQSFTTALSPSSPSAARAATNTTIRFAMISGDTISTRGDEPNQGSTASGERTNGGVHNFKRFLEDWSANGRQRLDYAGSLINLYNSRNANGSFKCCALVYNPPRRNWVFDSTFLDMNRLPPGTPMFQYVQTTGFYRTNE